MATQPGSWVQDACSAGRLHCSRPTPGLSGLTPHAGLRGRGEPESVLRRIIAATALGESSILVTRDRTLPGSAERGYLRAMEV